jgi:hypothetical protein
MYFTRGDGLRLSKIDRYFPELCLKLKEAGIDSRIDSLVVKWDKVETTSYRSEITSVGFAIHIVNTDWKYTVWFEPDEYYTTLHYKGILILGPILSYFQLTPTFHEAVMRTIHKWKVEIDEELFATTEGVIIKDKYARTS